MEVFPWSTCGESFCAPEKFTLGSATFDNLEQATEMRLKVLEELKFLGNAFRTLIPKGKGLPLRCKALELHNRCTAYRSSLEALEDNLNLEDVAAGVNQVPREFSKFIEELPEATFVAGWVSMEKSDNLAVAWATWGAEVEENAQLTKSRIVNGLLQKLCEVKPTDLGIEDDPGQCEKLRQVQEEASAFASKWAEMALRDCMEQLEGLTHRIEQLSPDATYAFPLDDLYDNSPTFVLVREAQETTREQARKQLVMCGVTLRGALEDMGVSLEVLPSAICAIRDKAAFDSRPAWWLFQQLDEITVDLTSRRYQIIHKGAGRSEDYYRRRKRELKLLGKLAIAAKIRLRDVPVLAQLIRRAKPGESGARATVSSATTSVLG